MPGGLGQANSLESKRMQTSDGKFRMVDATSTLLIPDLVRVNRRRKLTHYRRPGLIRLAQAADAECYCLAADSGRGQISTPICFQSRSLLHAD